MMALLMLLSSMQFLSHLPALPPCRLPQCLSVPQIQIFYKEINLFKSGQQRSQTVKPLLLPLPLLQKLTLLFETGSENYSASLFSHSPFLLPLSTSPPLLAGAPPPCFCLFLP